MSYVLGPTPAQGPAEADLRLAAEFARRLREVAGAISFEVTMFGSRARGDADPESDLDLFVLADAERLPAGFLDAARAISADLTLETGILVSLFVADGEYMRSHKGWSLLEAVMEEGVRI